MSYPPDSVGFGHGRSARFVRAFLVGGVGCSSGPVATAAGSERGLGRLGPADDAAPSALTMEPLATAVLFLDVLKARLRDRSGVTPIITLSATYAALPLIMAATARSEPCHRRRGEAAPPSVGTLALNTRSRTGGLAGLDPTRRAGRGVATRMG